MFVVEDSTIGAKLFVIDCTDDRRTLPECSQVQPLGSGYAAHWSLPESCSSCCGIRFNFAVPKPLVMIQYNGSGGCAAFNSNCILRIFRSASARSRSRFSSAVLNHCTFRNSFVSCIPARLLCSYRISFASTNRLNVWAISLGSRALSLARSTARHAWNSAINSFFRNGSGSLRDSAIARHPPARRTLSRILSDRCSSSL